MRYIYISIGKERYRYRDREGARLYDPHGVSLYVIPCYTLLQYVQYYQSTAAHASSTSSLVM